MVNSLDNLRGFQTETLISYTSQPRPHVKERRLTLGTSFVPTFFRPNRN